MIGYILVSGVKHRGKGMTAAFKLQQPWDRARTFRLLRSSSTEMKQQLSRWKAAICWMPLQYQSFLAL